MESSIKKVYFVMENVKQLALFNPRTDRNLFACFDREIGGPDWLLNDAKRIYNEIENSYYNYNDLIIHLLYLYLFKKTIYPDEINSKKVVETLNIFTIKQLEEDKKTLISINDKLKQRKGIEKYFELDHEHKTIIFCLIRKHHISPMFWIRYGYLFLVLNPKRTEEHEDHKYFRKILNYLKKHLDLTNQLKNT